MYTIIKFVIRILRVVPYIKSLFYRYYNKIYFKINNVSYGKGMVIMDSIYISGKGKITIGNDFKFLSGGNLNPICRNIKGSLYTMKPESKIVIGNSVGFSSVCLWSKDSISIGNNVNIGADCIIIDNDAHPHYYLHRRFNYMNKDNYTSFINEIPSAPIVIDDDVWIGARSQILKGVHIGARSIIGAGSIVTKSIPADAIACGNPCKVVRIIEQ
jgi:acetyltransferase-like isoleucine patch superfamily enzyme